MLAIDALSLLFILAQTLGGRPLKEPTVSSGNKARASENARSNDADVPKQATLIPVVEEKRSEKVTKSE